MMSEVNMSEVDSPLITHELLKSWSPCVIGFNRYCELFPEGATLTDAIAGLVADDHDDWGKWLFDQCANRKLYGSAVAQGYRNAGHSNAGHWNAGHRNAGDSNAGHWNAGDSNAGHWNAGHRNAGDSNAGDSNAGHWNAGHRNAGDSNAGHWNAGHRNAGDSNAGYWNAGDSNAGHSNAGDSNAGHSNAGHWNAGHWNAGHFNTGEPSEIRVFNKPCSREVWDRAIKPSFLYFNLTTWVDDSRMADQEKIDNPKFYVAGGYLKINSYKEAFQQSYAAASDEDKALLLKLPNFDADVFFEISGIRV